MRSFRASVAVSILLVSAAAPSRAALLSLLGTSTLDFRIGAIGEEATFETLQCGLGTVPALSPIQMNQPVELVPLAAGGGFSEPGGLFTGTRTFQVPFAVPATTFGCPLVIQLIDSVTIANVSNGTKVIAPGAAGGGHASGVLRAGGGLGGPGALAGTGFINVLGLFNLVVPLDAVGSTGGTAQFHAGTLSVTVLGTGWTTGAATITGVTTGVETPLGLALVDGNTVTVAGYDNRTPGHVGRVLLVSPFKVITNAVGNLPGLARQTLDFAGVVPEPGTLGLLVAGAAALALQGWRRMR
jgi:hypothetical protein